MDRRKKFRSVSICGRSTLPPPISFSGDLVENNNFASAHKQIGKVSSGWEPKLLTVIKRKVNELRVSARAGAESGRVPERPSDRQPEGELVEARRFSGPRRATLMECVPRSVAARKHWLIPVPEKKESFCRENSDRKFGERNRRVICLGMGVWHT